MLRARLWSQLLKMTNSFLNYCPICSYFIPHSWAQCPQLWGLVPSPTRANQSSYESSHSSATKCSQQWLVLCCFRAVSVLCLYDQEGHCRRSISSSGPVCPSGKRCLSLVQDARSLQVVVFFQWKPPSSFCHRFGSVICNPTLCLRLHHTSKVCATSVKRLDVLV